MWSKRVQIAADEYVKESRDVEITQEKRRKYQYSDADHMNRLGQERSLAHRDELGQ